MAWYRTAWSIGAHATWHDGIDRVTAVADTMNMRHFNLSLSWTNPRQATYSALAMLLTTGRHVSNHRRTIAWRQGLYGPALTAAGLTGYETGPGREESCHYPAYAANRRPHSHAVTTHPRAPHSST